MMGTTMQTPQVTGAGCCERTKLPAHTARAQASLAGEAGRMERIESIDRRREGHPCDVLRLLQDANVRGCWEQKENLALSPLGAVGLQNV